MPACLIHFENRVLLTSLMAACLLGFLVLVIIAIQHLNLSWEYYVNAFANKYPKQLRPRSRAARTCVFHPKNYNEKKTTQTMFALMYAVICSEFMAFRFVSFVMCVLARASDECFCNV